MAESQSMTTPEVVAKALIESTPTSSGGGGDRRRPADGGRDRRSDRCAGEASKGSRRPIATAIGRGLGDQGRGDRAGGSQKARPERAYFPSFLEPRQKQSRPCRRSSWRPMSTASPPARSIAWSSSSGFRDEQRIGSRRICRELDQQVEAFRSRPLEGEYPYLWLDAKHLRSGLRPRALQGAGDRLRGARDGRREVIGMEIGETETEAFWVAFLRELVARGLTGCG